MAKTKIMRVVVSEENTRAQEIIGELNAIKARRSEQARESLRKYQQMIERIEREAGHVRLS